MPPVFCQGRLSLCVVEKPWVGVLENGSENGDIADSSKIEFSPVG
jgi:hypothetical protein